MHSLAAFVAAFSLAAALVAVKSGEPTLWLLAAAALLCSVTTYRASAISSFLRVFAAIFAAETVVFGTLFLATQVGLWPEHLADYALPVSLPLTVAIFAILVFAVSFVPVVRAMTKIADRYFDTTDRTRTRLWPLPPFGARESTVAAAMVTFLVLINQAQVAMHVRLSFYYRDLYNAIQDKNLDAFWHQIFAVFTPLVFILVASLVVEYVVQSTLMIKWRKWLTGFYVGHWLDGSTHYRMTFAVGERTDNPDQRIAEDVDRFIDGGQVGYGIYSYSILLISKLSSLVSYTIILWGLSENLTLPLTSIVVPGLLFWLALSYAVVGSIFTHLIGRPLIRLSFIRQKLEADFRFKLARLREYSEQVALLRGEPAERLTLGDSFAAVVRNYFDIVNVRKVLITFTQTYSQTGTFLPLAFTAPFYFSGKMTLGTMRQSLDLFNSVTDALTFFIDYYVSLANFKSVLDRLRSFEAAIDHAKSVDFERPEPAGPRAAARDLDIEALKLKLPDGRTIVEAPRLHIRAHEPALVMGPSGSGKSTLFRAISGIWPFGEGVIDVPADATLMLLPQRPYLPIGPLRQAVTYPAPPDTYTDDEIAKVLRIAQLSDLALMLNVDDVWSQRLSGGEQQRLAIARALLAKPDWLFLDESTSAMDEGMEAEIYQALAAHLPETTIVSIGHRASLQRFHKRRIELQPKESGAFTAVEVAGAAAR